MKHFTKWRREYLKIIKASGLTTARVPLSALHDEMKQAELKLGHQIQNSISRQFLIEINGSSLFKGLGGLYPINRKGSLAPTNEPFKWFWAGLGAGVPLSTDRA